jgi:hypothetical protein
MTLVELLTLIVFVWVGKWVACTLGADLHGWAHALCDLAGMVIGFAVLAALVWLRSRKRKGEDHP